MHVDPSLTRTDRGGAVVLLRRVRAEDLPAVFELERATLADGRGMVLAPDEGPADVEELRRRIHADLDPAHPGRTILLGAFVNGLATGTLTVRAHRFRSLAHVALLSMGVDPAWQGRGHGRLLLETALQWADARRLRRLELYVRADNDRARALYTSVGFVVESVRPAFVRTPQGFVDDLVMVRYHPALADPHAPDPA